MKRHNPWLGVALGLAGWALGSSMAAQAADAPAAAAVEELEEVVVTGTNIRGAAPTGSALIAVDRTQIEESAGVTMSAILLETPQVMNFGITEASRSGNGGAGNITLGSSINIRGISPFATLTLIDGHRMTPNGTTGAAPDPNVLPTIALERVEIVADGASAIYGSDAIAGVANLILRRKVKGFEASAHYGIADGYTDRNLGAIWGTQWSTGNLMLAVEDGQHSNLNGVDRDFFRSDLRANGGADNRVTQCYPGNVVVGTTTYPIPASNVSAATLVAGTASRCDNIKYIDLIPEQDHKAAAFTYDQSFGDKFSVFGQGYWARREFVRINPTPAANLTVPSSNAFYIAPAGVTPPLCAASAGAPAGARCETVQYSYANDFGPNNSIFAASGFAETYNVLGGAAYKLPADWRVEGSFSYGKDLERANSLGINNAALTLALASSNPATALNPFGTSVNNAAMLNGLVVQVSIAPGKSIQRTYDLKADGPLFHLPGGEVRAAVGVGQLYVSLRGGQTTGALSAPALISVYSDRTVKSAFAELAIPLVGDANAVTGIRRLDLSLAGRREKYSDFGTTSHPKVGLNWTIVDGFMAHASYGTSFRAPGLSQLRSIAAPGIFVQNYSDPLANGGAGGITQGAAINGGNVNLGPEKATTWSYGIDWTPPSVPGLSVSLNYFDLKYTDQVISYLSNLLILQNPVAFGSVFQRRPSDPAGSAAFTALLQSYINEGRVLNGGTAAQIAALNVFVDGRPNNQAVTKAKGLDFDARYHLQTASHGSFNFGFAGTRFTSYSTSATATAPLLDELNRINFPPQFRARLTGAWSGNEGWRARVAFNRTGGYTNDLANPVQEVRAYMTVDARVGYDIADRTSSSLLRDLSIAFEVTNVFGADPPFVNIAPSVNGGGGFDPNTINPIGRLIGLTVNKRF
jgi:iron complex outermembrane recepter protein